MRSINLEQERCTRAHYHGKVYFPQKSLEDASSVAGKLQQPLHFSLSKHLEAMYPELRHKLP